MDEFLQWLETTEVEGPPLTAHEVRTVLEGNWELPTEAEQLAEIEAHLLEAMRLVTLLTY